MKKKTYSKYEIDKLLKNLKEMHGISMNLMVKDAPCFTQSEFEKHYGKIMILAANRNNIEKVLLTLIEETL